MNWGKGITIVIAVFMVHILFLVYKTTSVRADLQAIDYYAQEIHYQDRMDALKNTKGLKDLFYVSQTEKNVLFSFPSDFKKGGLTGNIELFKPDNAKLDITFPISSSAIQQISKSELVKGWYVVKIDVVQNNDPYFFEESIYIE